MNADTNIAYVNVQSNVPSAQLFVDGVEIKSSKPGTWRPIGRKPGKYTVLVKAEGYEDHQEQIELAKGQAKQLSVALTPKAVVITTAYLAVEGGTPGAEVFIDGMPTKALDSAGSARIEVSPGPHKIGFRKDSFEPSTDMQQNFARGQEIRIGANEAKLKEFGTLQFRITPPDAQVSYRRGDRDAQHARGRDSVRVPEGKYSITVESAGFATLTRNDVTVSSSQTVPIEISLAAAEPSKSTAEAGNGRSPESLFERPEQIGTMGDWWISKIDAEYVFLKPGALRQFNLAFLNPGKNFLGRQKKMEWVIGYVSGRDKIVYEFDGKKLNRKVYSGGKSANAAVACQSTDKAFQFQMSIQPNRVEVQSPACDQMDSYESRGPRPDQRENRYQTERRVPHPVKDRPYPRPRNPQPTAHQCFLQAAIDYAGHVPRAMHDSNNLDRLLLRDVDDKVGSNGPEAERGYRQIFTYVPEFRSLR